MPSAADMLTYAETVEFRQNFELALQSSHSIGVDIHYTTGASNSNSGRPFGYQGGGAGTLTPAAVENPVPIETRGFMEAINEYQAKRFPPGVLNVGDVIWMFSDSLDLTGKTIVRIRDWRVIDEDGTKRYNATYRPKIMNIPPSVVMSVLKLAYGSVCQAVVAESQF